MYRFLFLSILLVVLGCAGSPVAPGGRQPLTENRQPTVSVANEPTAGEAARAAPAAAVVAAVVAEAIRSRRPLAFTYKGVLRVAHPHRMGPSAAGNGKTLVRCWEVSRGGEATGTWKLFEVGKASGARLLPGRFAPAGGYTPRDRAIPEPTAEVPAPEAR